VEFSVKVGVMEFGLLQAVASWSRRDRQGNCFPRKFYAVEKFGKKSCRKSSS